MIKTFIKLWKFSENEKPYITKATIINFIYAIFNALMMAAIYIVIKAVLNNHTDKKYALYGFGIMVISVTGKIICQNFSQLDMTHAGYFMTSDKRLELGDKLKNIAMGFFNKNTIGNITSVATSVATDLENSAARVLVMILSGLLNTAVFSIFILFFDYRIGIITILGIIMYLIFTIIFDKRAKKNIPKRQKARGELIETILEAIQGMFIIKTYNLADKNSRKVNKSIKNSFRVNYNLEKALLPSAFLQAIVLKIFSVIIIIISLYLFFNGSMELINCIMMIIASFIIFTPLNSAGSVITELRIVESSMNEIQKALETPTMEEGHLENGENGNVEFKNVDFSYDKKRILNNINFSIPEKTITAIIGPSGSGKTTICNLIARFWDVDKGEVLVGNINVKDYRLNDFMKNISMVFQNVYLFEDTIENNIKFGNQNATREKVIEAAKKAECHDFIMSLPNNYDTVIGEGGSSLSGGEKQRISIARAVLKDSPIIIFDEATANVDPENEDKLQRAIEKLTKEKTVIMIAHRLKTIRNADQIIVMDKGEIESIGKHEELLEKSKIYNNFISRRKIAENWEI